MLSLARPHDDEDDSGFTLIELLVVIIIIGILAAIAIPVFLNQRQKGYDAQSKSDLRNVATQEESYFTDTNAYSESITDTSTGTACPNVPNTNPTVVCYRKSTNTAAISAGWVTSAGALTQGTLANAANGYCAWTLSDSGTTFYFDSVKGGLSTTHTNAAC